VNGMIPNFIPHDNGIREGNNDDNTPDHAAEPSDDKNNEDPPNVTNHGHYDDFCEDENKAEDRRGRRNIE
jgi:hypothetical protein